jgi:hypothetical protein
MPFAFGEGLSAGNNVLGQQQQQKNDALKAELDGKKLQLESAKLAQSEFQNRQKMAQDLFTQSVDTMKGIAETVKNMPQVIPGSAVDQALEQQKVIVAKLAGMIGQDPTMAQVMADTIRASVGSGIKPMEPKVVGNQLVQPNREGGPATVVHTAPEAPQRPTDLMQEAEFAFPGDRNKQRELVAGARTKAGSENTPLMKEAEAMFPGDKQAQQDFITKARNRPDSTVNIDQRQELEAEKTEGRALGDAGAEVIKERERSSASIEKMGVVKQLADQWKAQGGQLGALAGQKISVGKMAQAIGVNPASLGLPESTDMGEALIAMSNEMAMGRIGGQGGMPANNFSEADRKFLVETVPNIENTERGFNTKLAIGARVAQRKIEAADIYEEARANKKSVSEALAEVRKQLRDKPLFNDEEQRAMLGIAKPQEKQIDFSKMDRRELLNMDASKLDPEQRRALKEALGRK